MNTIGSIKDKNILFLQGPMGNFFQKIDKLFRENGSITYKIGFNAGDRFFSYKDNYIAYKNTRENYKEFIAEFLKKQSIDKMFLFGDCRFYQNISIKVAEKLNIEVFVFEEGYIRPNYITMEKYGVNDFSHISRKASFYHKIILQKEALAEDTNLSQFKMIMSACIYYSLSNIFSFQYPNYMHHRDFSAIKELFYGSRSLIRKFIFPFYEKKYLFMLQNELSKNYFFVPLQTHNDFQILEHSGYRSIEKFIIEVLESFAKSKSQSWLVFKHHPIDRGRKTYKEFIVNQAEILKIEKKVLILFDTYLPICLKNAMGTVTINSTVGLSSLYHGTPTITLGNAIYDIDGLTCKGMTLEKFWQTRNKPDMNLLKKYRQFIIDNTQLNASYYGKMPNFSFS